MILYKNKTTTNKKNLLKAHFSIGSIWTTSYSVGAKVLCIFYWPSVVPFTTLHQPLWNWYSTKGSIKKLNVFSSAFWSFSMVFPGSVVRTHYYVSWRALLLANIPLSVVNCSASVPAERPCGIALCVHITLILCIKACTAAHAHHRTHARATMGKLVCQWIALDSTGLKSPAKTFNVEWLSLWWLISEEPAKEYYPPVAGSLQPQGESECTEESTAAMWRFKSNSSQRISFLWLSRSSKRHSTLCWTEGEKSLPFYTFPAPLPPSQQALTALSHTVSWLWDWDMILWALD